MVRRRELAKLAGAAGALLPWEMTFTRSLAAPLGATPAIPQFVTPLPIPAVAPKAATSPYGDTVDYYEIEMKDSTWPLFSPNLGPATTWGYRASGVGVAGTNASTYLGPTIEAKRGRPVVVKYINNLPGTFPIPGAIDPTIMGNDPDDEAYYGPIGRGVPHLHGGFTPPQFDGTPRHWWTKAGEHDPEHLSQPSLPNNATNEAIYWYSNQQPAALLWYHDHALGITRLNVYVGLAGLYLLRDADTGDTGLPNNSYGLPAGAYEVPLVIQDKQFNADGTLFYPTSNEFIPNEDQPHAIWVPEFFGDTPVVNAVAYPYLEIEPRRYRLRAVNGSQARFYNLYFQHSKTGKSLPFWVIGMDQSLLPKPVQVSTLLIAPGERADVVMDFSAMAGASVTLMNNAPAPYPGGARDVPGIPRLMQFRVTKSLSGTDTTTVPSLLALPKVAGLKVDTRPEREIVLKELLDEYEQPVEVTLNDREFLDPVEEQPRVGTVEVWDFINTTGDAHPMHMHLVQFQVVSRQPFNAEKCLAAYNLWVKAGRPVATKPVLADYLSGNPSPPSPEETGWKDTAKAYPGQVLKVKAKFDVPPADPSIAGTATVLPAEYVYHCHILEHEENDMMRPFQVVA